MIALSPSAISLNPLASRSISALSRTGQSRTDLSKTDLNRAERQQQVQLMGQDYWQRLMLEGIPKKQARRIAAAIAKFDIAQRPPKPYQEALIRHYCPNICRANLWRRQLLLEEAE